MKKFILICAIFMLTLTFAVGCGQTETPPPADTEPSGSADDPTPPSDPNPPVNPDPPADPSDDPAPDPSVDTPPAKPEDDKKCDHDTADYYVDEVYIKQIERYYTAVSEQWNESEYFDHGMSALAAYYYEGTPLDNLGFAYIDLDNDGTKELILGAILNAERDPLVLEIWTIKNNEPVMLAQSGSHNRYYLQYAEEDGIWSVAYEAENGAANHAVYYLQLSGGQFNVIQGIVFDAVANEKAPWFMAYDLDWDVSNDMPIKENTANSVISAGRNIYTAARYFPYCLYK